jgi:hypothetical protein
VNAANRARGTSIGEYFLTVGNALSVMSSPEEDDLLGPFEVVDEEEENRRVLNEFFG